VALLVVILMVCYLSGGKIQGGVTYSGIKPSTFPLFFGITIFSFSMHGVILGIEDGMKHKEELPRTCNICAVVVTSIYSLFGAVGFAGYRSAPGGIDQSIISNLQRSIPVQLVEALLCMSMFLSVPLFAFPVFEFIEAAWIKVGTPEARRARLRFCFRTSLVVFMVALATLLGPMFADVVSFVGAFSMSFLVFIMPCAFFIKTHKETAPRLEIAKAWAVLVFGVIGMATASTVSTYEIIQYFQGGNSKQCDADLTPTLVPTPAPGMLGGGAPMLPNNLTATLAAAAASAIGIISPQ